MGPADHTPFARLVAAIEGGDVAAAELALLDGADATGLIAWMGDGTPVLVRAAELGHLNIVNLLLNHGADIHARAFVERQSMFHDDTYIEQLNAPVQAAIFRRHLDVTELLLQRGANAFDAVAASLDHPPLLKLVLDRGASPDGPHLGRCVIAGSGDGHLDALKLLLEYGADPDQLGWGDKTVVRNAIEFGRLEAAQLLLAAGATRPALVDVQKAVDDAYVRSEPAFRERALATARALGFEVSAPTKG